MNPANSVFKQLLILVLIEALTVEAIGFHKGIFLNAVLQQDFLGKIRAPHQIMVVQADFLSYYPIKG